VGIDFAEPMIELARRRLERFGRRATLILEDFLAARIPGRFDVILALGLFDYLPEPDRFTQRMFELCAERGCLVGSFPAWSPLKGPIRKLRYEWIGNCPIFNYTREGMELMLRTSGFERLEIESPAHTGFLVRAYRG
jgi:SAM-dependent methyltransferase